MPNSMRIFAGLIVVLVLAGCGSSGPTSQSSSSATSSSSSAASSASSSQSSSSSASVSIAKPHGLFPSAGSTNTDVVNHPQARGVLIRVPWNELEPAASTYDFSRIDNQLALLKSAGKGWSLAVVAGPSSPAWLYASPYSVVPLNITFRSQPTQVPQFWSTALQGRLTVLAQALAARYGNDPDLQLVYLPQMSANGIEGHFNGNTDQSLTAQGFTEDHWVESVLQATVTFATAFSDKPIAVELHYILSSANAGIRIMETIENDLLLRDQAGVAIWWLSGKIDYQPDLLTAFASFQGSIYAQLIDKSDNPASFLNNDYSTAFAQAKALNIKYIEPWEVDFTSHSWDALFADFNTYAQP